MTTAIGTDGGMSAEIALVWSLMTGRAFEMGIPCVTVQSFLVDRSSVVVYLRSGARGMIVGSGKRKLNDW